MKLQKLQRVVKRLVNAEINHSWRGAQHPDEWSHMDKQLKMARAAYQRLLKELRDENQSLT